MTLAMKAASVVGLVLLVVAYVLNQRGAWHPKERPYLAANAVGAALLAVYSAWIGEWVFVALEGFWSLVSLVPLLRPAARG